LSDGGLPGGGKRLVLSGKLVLEREAREFADERGQYLERLIRSA